MVTDDTIRVGIGTSFVYPDVVTLGAFVNFEGSGVVAFDDHLGLVGIIERRKCAYQTFIFARSFIQEGIIS